MGVNDGYENLTLFSYSFSSQSYMIYVKGDSKELNKLPLELAHGLEQYLKKKGKITHLYNAKHCFSPTSL